VLCILPFVRIGDVIWGLEKSPAHEPFPRVEEKAASASARCPECTIIKQQRYALRKSSRMGHMKTVGLTSGIPVCFVPQGDAVAAKARSGDKLNLIPGDAVRTATPEGIPVCYWSMNCCMLWRKLQNTRTPESNAHIVPHVVDTAVNVILVPNGKNVSCTMLGWT